MMVFPSMLMTAATQAGMKVPTESELERYEEVEDLARDFPDFIQRYPHFHVFCNLQLCRPIRWGEHWENAKVIAAIPLEKLKTMTLEDFIAAGLEYHTAPSI
jgi:hypothetical protein